MLIGLAPPKKRRGKNVFNELRATFRKSDMGKQPTNQDLKELRRCLPQIEELTNSGIVSKIKNRKHAYIVGAERFRIVNGNTVVPE